MNNEQNWQFYFKKENFITFTELMNRWCCVGSYHQTPWYFLPWRTYLLKMLWTNFYFRRKAAVSDRSWPQQGWYTLLWEQFYDRAKYYTAVHIPFTLLLNWRENYGVHSNMKQSIMLPFRLFLLFRWAKEKTVEWTWAKCFTAIYIVFTHLKNFREIYRETAINIVLLISPK